MGYRIRSLAASPAAVLLAAAVLAAGVPRDASPEASGMNPGEPEVELRPVEVKLHDLEMLDQDGRTVRFRSDVVGDRIAVVTTFFTSCGLICPILSAIYADLQDRLGDRLGNEVALISISVDPRTDIPPRLKNYAGVWEAKPGWVFLTGEKLRVDRVLEGLGLYSADFTSHPAAFLVGDGKNGRWTRFNGFATPEQLESRIESLLSARGTNSSSRTRIPPSAGK